MAQPVKRPLAKPTPHIRAEVAALAALSPTQLPNAPGKAAHDGPSVWAPVTHVGGPDGAPGSWLQPGSYLAFEASWGVKQQTEDCSLSFSLCLQIIPSGGIPILSVDMNSP